MGSIRAFLLTLPFSSGFSELNERDRVVYMVSLISAACSLVLLLGESAYHRMRENRTTRSS